MSSFILAISDFSSMVFFFVSSWIAMNFTSLAPTVISSAAMNSPSFVTLFVTKSKFVCAMTSVSSQRLSSAETQMLSWLPSPWGIVMALASWAIFRNARARP